MIEKIEDDPLIGDMIVDLVNDWSSQTSTKDEIDNALISYHRYVYRKWIFMFICIIATVIVMGVALTIGAYDIKFLESYVIVWQNIFGDVQDTMKDYIIMDLRMPRIIAGVIAGSGLAIAGVVMQSILKNPLADPYTTGVSSGALFGATLAMTMGANMMGGEYAIVINAFIFSLVPTLVIVTVSKMRMTSPTIMIMAGIAVMYIFNAMTTLIKLQADPNSLASIYQWQVGSLTMVDWSVIPLMAVIVATGIILMQFVSRKLNVLFTGDENAKAMGINVESLRIFCLVIVAIVSAVIVSFTGLIGFVGLVAPHVVRIFIGPDNRYLIPASAIFGALLLVAADLLGRVVIAPATLQVGVITAFLGGPLFLWLIMRRKSNVW